MKVRCKRMDYFKLAGYGCIFLGGWLLFSVLAYKLHGWWQSRFARKSLKAIRQLEDEHYEGLRESLLRHIDEMIRKVDRQ